MSLWHRYQLMDYDDIPSDVWDLAAYVLETDSDRKSFTMYRNGCYLCFHQHHEN